MNNTPLLDKLACSKRPLCQASVSRQRTCSPKPLPKATPPTPPESRMLQHRLPNDIFRAFLDAEDMRCELERTLPDQGRAQRTRKGRLSLATRLDTYRLRSTLERRHGFREFELVDRQESGDRELWETARRTGWRVALPKHSSTYAHPHPEVAHMLAQIQLAVEELALTGTHHMCLLTHRGDLAAPIVEKYIAVGGSLLICAILGLMDGPIYRLTEKSGVSFIDLEQLGVIDLPSSLWLPEEGESSIS